MLRKRSRSISKEVSMAEYNGTIRSPTADRSKTPTSFPRLFTGFTFKNFSEATEAAISPTSILDSKSFSCLKNPFWSDPNPTPKSPEPETKRHWSNLDSKGIGLAIVDSLTDDDKLETNVSKPESRMVLFGSQLKIQIPPLVAAVISPIESPKSPADFGIKTKNSLLGSFSSGMSHSPMKKSGFGSDNSGMNTPSSPGVFTASLSASEMELSEDYTCVIVHGPNPTTTHIFDNCIIESCCGIVDDSASRKHNHGFLNDGLSYPSDDFLSFCYACKKDLGQGKDIYMYRGEKAFCSSECRYQEILLDEAIDIS